MAAPEGPLRWSFARVWARRELYTLRLPLGDGLVRPGLAGQDRAETVHGDPLRLTSADGVLEVLHDGAGPAEGRVRLLPADPFGTVEADVEVHGDGAVAVELASADGARRVVVTADRRTGTLGARLDVDGVVLARLEQVRVDLDAPLTLLVQLQGRSVLVWWRRGTATAYVGRLDLAPQLDLRDRGARAGWTTGLLVAGGPGTAARCSRLEVALSGNGHADPRLVTYDDGSPVQEGSTVWFLATTRGSLIEDAYQGVYALDTATGTVSMTGALFAERDSDGVRRNDNAGVLVVDRASGVWSWLAVGHSDHPAPRALWTGTSTDDLRHGSHVVPVVRVEHDASARGAHWEDVHPVRTDGGWVAVASKDARRTAWLVSDGGLAGPWRETRTAVGVDETGPLLLDVDGRRYVVAGTGTDAFVVRDAEDASMPVRGYLRLDHGTAARRVWPAVFRVEEEDGPRWYLLSFDRSTPAGPYSYGALHLYRQV